jgi:hypothetical protein
VRIVGGGIRGLKDEEFIKFILTNFLLWRERLLHLQPCSEGMGGNELNKWG